HVSHGQYVPISAPLITIIDLRECWVRVPVPEYDWPLVNATQEVQCTWKNPNHVGPQQTGKPPLFKGRPMGGVRQVDPNKHTAELWYELDPLPVSVLKDEMVTAMLPIGKKQSAIVVPDSAIVYDSHGQTWIYLQTDKK